MSVQSGQGLCGRRCRVSGAAWSVWRGRVCPGAARDARRRLCRCGRRGVGGSMDKVLFKRLLSRRLRVRDGRAATGRLRRRTRDCAGVASPLGCWRRSLSWGCRCSSSRPTSARPWGSSGSPSPPRWSTRWSRRWRTTSWRSSRRWRPASRWSAACSACRSRSGSRTARRRWPQSPGEIAFAGEWYDYAAKYTPGGMELIVPARISDDRECASARARRRDVRAGRL